MRLVLDIYQISHKFPPTSPLSRKHKNLELKQITKVFLSPLLVSLVQMCLVVGVKSCWVK